jgi:hypothetical protein
VGNFGRTPGGKATTFRGPGFGNPSVSSATGRHRVTDVLLAAVHAVNFDALLNILVN